MDNEENGIESQLDSAINEENDSFGSDNSVTGDNNEENSEGTESLDDIMSSISQKTTKTGQQNVDKVGTTTQNTQRTTQQRQRGSNNSGDLVDKDGNIIAKAGAERRFYEQAMRLKQERDVFHSQVLPKLRKNYSELQSRVKSYTAAMEALKANDLSSDDIQTGIELIRQWRKSPADTMKFLLTQAKSYGINIDDGTKSTTDLAAISQMIDEKLRPFNQERENAQRVQQIRQNATSAYKGFINKYPDVRNHTNEIAYLLKSDPSLSLDTAYYVLRNYYSTKGYNFNTPLAEINKQKSKNNASFNMPNVNQTNQTANVSGKVASINSSYKDIIKDVLKNVKR